MKSVKGIFGYTIEQFLPPPIRRADLVALFQGRASYWLIQAWRYGNRYPPEWARELLAEKLANPAAAILALPRRTRTLQESCRATGKAWQAQRRLSGLTNSRPPRS